MRIPFFVQLTAPASGVNTHLPPTLIGDEQTPSAQNVRFDGGTVFKRVGYAAMSSASIASGPVLMDEFQRLAGGSSVMLATTSNLYRWTGSAWSSIKSGLLGTPGGYHSACVMNDTWVYTNGLNHVQKWTGTGNASDLGGGTDYQTPAYHLCRAVAAYSDRLLLLGTNEDGESHPYRIRWGELGKLEEWNINEGGGYADLTEDPTGLQGAELLGDWLAIYGGQSIWLGQYVGGAAIFTFPRVIPNMGCRAPRTIADIGNEHIFLGEDDVYRFNGTALTPIGARVRKELIQGVSRGHKIRCFAVLNTDEHLYRLYVPYANASGAITRCYVYNYQDDTWGPDTAVDIMAGVAAELGTRKTIDELPHAAIDIMPHEPIDHLGKAAGQRYTVFAASGGLTYQDDGRTLNDADNPIIAWWDTKDLVLHSRYVEQFKRVQAVAFEAMGDSVTVSYSTDAGRTYTALGTQALGTDWLRYKMDMDVTCRTIRLRFANAASNSRFWLRWLGVKGFVVSDR